MSIKFTLTLFSLLFLPLFNSCTDEKFEPNKNQPVIIEEPFRGRICFIGDTGTGKKEQFDVARALEQAHPKKVYVLGDVIYETGIKNKSDKDFTEKFLEPYDRLLHKQIPFYISLGNHDYRGSTKAWLDIHHEYKSIVFPNLFYAHKFGNLCIVGLDTNDYFVTQENWLKLIAPQLSDCEISMAFAHHPYLSPGEHGNAQGAVKDFLESSVIGKFDFYFAGHDHNQAYIGQVQGTHLILSGAGGKVRKLIDHDSEWASEKYGFMCADINDSSVFLDFITVNEDEFQTEFTKYIN